MAGQAKLVTLSEVEKTLIHELQAKYPRQNAQAFMLAAIRYYAPKALRGIDGNLDPLEGDQSVIAEMLTETVRKLSARKRAEWTTEQRQAFKALKADDPTITTDMVEWGGTGWRVLR